VTLTHTWSMSGGGETIRSESGKKKTISQRFPELEPGVNLVKTRKKEVFHALVSQRLHSSGGECIWVDADNHASTRFMSLEGLDKEVKVARAFTAHQHHKLVKKAEAQAGERTSLMALPSMNYLYEKDSVPEYEKQRIFAEALRKTAKVSEAHEVPALVTASPGEMEWMIETVSSQIVEVESTSQGPRLETDDFSPSGYHADRNGFQASVKNWISEPEVVKPGTH
jgi:hypothetical protein